MLGLDATCRMSFPGMVSIRSSGCPQDPDPGRNHNDADGKTTVVVGRQKPSTSYIARPTAVRLWRRQNVTVSFHPSATSDALRT